MNTLLAQLIVCIVIAACAVAILIKKKAVTREPQKGLEKALRKCNEQSREDYTAIIKPNCFGSLDSLLLLSFSEEKSTDDILKLAVLKGWRPLQGDEVKMFSDLSISACEKGLYVNLLDFGTDCYAYQYDETPIPQAKHFKFHRSWKAGTFFTFVAKRELMTLSHR